MARTTITPVTLLGSRPTLQPAANAADYAYAACDIVNLNQTPHTGKEVLLFRNDDAGSVTLTISSVADALKRTGDITDYPLGAGEFCAFGPFDVEGWRQSDGYLYFQGSDADLKVAVLRLP